VVRNNVIGAGGWRRHATLQAHSAQWVIDRTNGRSAVTEIYRILGSGRLAVVIAGAFPTLPPRP
jgi:hypothetical protein